MAKLIKRLSAVKVRKITAPGWYPDGEGLYLQVSPSGSKSWVYRYKNSGKEHRHGLGRYSADNSLGDARLAAGLCRKLRRGGIDPINNKRQRHADRLLEDAKAVTFKECATQYIESNKSGWKCKKHEAQWTNTLTTYAYPYIGDISVQKIDVGMVMQVIEPIWQKKTETASRVRQRIEKILDWAKVRQYRTGDNPAQWRGHIENLLPKRSKVQKVQPYLPI